MSPLEIAATLLGVIGVWLMIRQNIWAWPVGLVQVATFGWVMYRSKLYSDAILQVFFFLILAYGWWHWLRGRGRQEIGLPVTRLSRAKLLGWIALGAAAAWAWGDYMHRTTQAATPHWDAFILMFSLIAQWLQARKQLETWSFWLVVNVVAMAVYWSNGLPLMAALSVVYFGMAVAGLRSWKKSMATP